MDKGVCAADVNVSVRKPRRAAGTRCEIKNMNVDHIYWAASEHEARRPDRDHRGGGSLIDQDAFVRPQQGLTRLDSPRKRRTTNRYSRSRPPCRSTSPRVCRGTENRACRNCRTRRKRASIADFHSPPMTQACCGPSARREFFETVWRTLFDPARDGKFCGQWVIASLVRSG